MKARKTYVILIVLLIVAACGGSDGDNGGGDGTTTASNGGTTADDGASGSTSPSDMPGTTTGATGGGGGEVTEMGSFTVDGTVFPVTLLNRCVPFGDREDAIDLQALSNGVGAKLNLARGFLDDVSVDGSMIEEQFGSIAFSNDPETEIESEVSGDRWTGSATLFDVLESVEPVEVTWDVMIPSEINDCGL